MQTRDGICQTWPSPCIPDCVHAPLQLPMGLRTWTPTLCSHTTAPPMLLSCRLSSSQPPAAAAAAAVTRCHPLSCPACRRSKPSLTPCPSRHPWALVSTLVCSACTQYARPHVMTDIEELNPQQQQDVGICPSQRYPICSRSWPVLTPPQANIPMIFHIAHAICALRPVGASVRSQACSAAYFGLHTMLKFAASRCRYHAGVMKASVWWFLLPIA